MRRMTRGLPWFYLSAAAICGAATPQEMITAQVPAARKILDSWQAENPEREERKLQIVLWTPADREPAPRHRERLSAILDDIRDFYAEEMERLGFGPRTFPLEREPDGLVKIHFVKGKGDYAKYDGDSGGEIRNECLGTLRAAGIDPEDTTVVIFCNMSVWDPEGRKISQNSPYYAGGTHRRGTAWQVDSPILDLDFLAKQEPRVKDGQYGDISVGKYNSIFIGGIAHELGHALGLPHNCERMDEKAAFGTALMGAGNRSYGEDRRGEGKGSFLTLAHGLRLASHPAFCGSVKGNELRANVEPEALAVARSGKGFTVSGKVTAVPPVYGVLGYMDPEGGSDYDATTTTAVPAADGRFTLDCQALKAGKAGEFRLVFLQANGVASGFLSETPFRYPYTVAADGAVDVSTMTTLLRLKPLTDAILKDDLPVARAAFADPGLKDDVQALEIGRRLLDSLAAEPAPELAGDPPTMALSDLKPSRQEVGYGRLLRDRLPEAPVILANGGRIFRHGFFAHAPSTLTWNLTGEKWTRFSGSAGLPDGRDGSVGFTIEGDGKVLWKSGLILEGKSESFRIDLRGVRSLTLRADDGGDGRSTDWALWLEPTLIRE